MATHQSRWVSTLVHIGWIQLIAMARYVTNLLFLKSQVIHPVVARQEKTHRVVKCSNISQAILWWSFAYDGSAADAEALLAPFNQIGSLHEDTGDVPYPEIPGIQGTSYASGGCNPANRAFSHALLKNYTVSAQREIYEQYVANIAKYPSLASTAVVYHEGYATKAAAEVEASLTAYPHRDELHIVYFMVSVPDTPGLFAQAQQWADDVQTIWNRGREPAYYVNYDTGVESLEATYGYEPWRLQKLRGLKAKYDPNNRFRYFMPINSQ